MDNMYNAPIQPQEPLQPQKSNIGLKVGAILALLVLFSAVGYFVFVNDSNKKESNEEEKKVHEKRKGREGDSFIWEVKSDTTTIYLVGSIHIGKEKIEPMPQVLLDAFYDSDIIAPEIDMVAYENNVALQYELLPYMMHLDGTTIEDYVSEEMFTALDEFIKERLKRNPTEEMAYMFNLANMPSFLTGFMIADAGYESANGVDMYFLNLAHEIKKPVVELELILDQAKMSSEYSKGLQEMLLNQIIYLTKEEFEEEVNGLHEMYEAWSTGDLDYIKNQIETEEAVYRACLASDIEALKKIAEERDVTLDLSVPRQQILDEMRYFVEYHESMMLNRNQGMAEKALEMLNGDKKVFYMVGAAHMFGESGLINQLELAGFTVTQKI